MTDGDRRALLRRFVDSWLVRKLREVGWDARTEPCGVHVDLDIGGDGMFWCWRRDPGGSLSEDVEAIRSWVGALYFEGDADLCHVHPLHVAPGPRRLGPVLEGMRRVMRECCLHETTDVGAPFHETVIAEWTPAELYRRCHEYRCTDCYEPMLAPNWEPTR